MKVTEAHLNITPLTEVVHKARLSENAGIELLKCDAPALPILQMILLYLAILGSNFLISTSKLNHLLQADQSWRQLSFLCCARCQILATELLANLSNLNRVTSE